MMEFDTQTVFGPKTASASRSEALTQLQTHPNFPKGALILDIEDKSGQWVAKIGTPKTAEFPPSDDGGDKGPPSGPPSDDDGDEGAKPEPADDGGDEPEGGPPKADGEKGEGKPKKPSVEEAVLHLTDLVSQIADALGIGGGPGLPGGGPEVPGDVPPPPAGPPGAGGPPGHGGPPHGGGPAGPPAHAMKPGMAPPGTTPVGSPAFASTHPWENLLGKVALFKVTSEPTDQQVAEAWDELDALAIPVGYKTTQVKPFTDEQGNRRIKALVVAKNRL